MPDGGIGQDQGSDSSFDAVGLDKYVGNWKDGKRNGKGTYTSGLSRNFYKYVGEWKNGEMWNGIYYDKNGKIKYKIVNVYYIKQ
ncbi:MAG TPA: hypothetical protein EYM60_05265 [Candidatus Marinimicrobia bacterium]|nr:hypothetical protein [Candidatus Neomarinimicrobiota bacterium]